MKSYFDCLSEPQSVLREAVIQRFLQVIIYAFLKLSVCTNTFRNLVYMPCFCQQSNLVVYKRTLINQIYDVGR